MIKIRSVLIIGPFPPPVTGKALANKVVYSGLIEKGLRVGHINTSSPVIETDFGKLTFKKLRFLKNYLFIYRVLMYDIVYATIGLTFFGVLKFAPFLALAKLLRKKVVFHLHGNYLHTTYEKLRGWRKIVFQYTLKTADKAIVLSESMRVNFEPFLEDNKILVVKNFYQKELHLTEEEILCRKEFGKLNILFLSNLIPEKGVIELLEAVRLLNKHYPNRVKTFLAGNLVGNLSKLMQLIEEIPAVSYLNVLDTSQKRDILLHSNVVCLPTYYSMEGQPLCIIEGMATGNAILTTKHAAIPEIVDENSALFCEKRNPISIYEKFVYLLENPKKHEQMVKYNINYAHKNFQSERFVSDIHHILQKL